MSITEIIIAVLVLVAVIGQFVFIVWRRQRTFFKARTNAKRRAELIEREYDKQN